MQGFLDRTFLILGHEGIEVLSAPLIAISGLGGVGGGTFLNLVRSGVKRFRLAENGVFDTPDMNRQAAAFASTLGRPKIEVYEELARGINPEIELELFPEGLLTGNLERFLDGSDVNIGVIDFEKGADVKAMTPDLLKRFNVPLFSAMVFGFGAILVAHHPEGMMPDEFWGLARKRSAGEGFPLLYVRQIRTNHSWTDREFLRGRQEPVNEYRRRLRRCDSRFRSYGLSSSGNRSCHQGNHFCPQIHGGRPP